MTGAQKKGRRGGKEEERKGKREGGKKGWKEGEMGEGGRKENLVMHLVCVWWEEGSFIGEKILLSGDPLPLGLQIKTSQKRFSSPYHL